MTSFYGGPCWCRSRGGFDAVLGEGGGEVDVDATYGGRRGGAVFGKDHDVDTGGGFCAQGVVEFPHGAGAAVAEVVGGNPYGIGGGANSVQKGLTEGLGGEEADSAGAGALARWRAAESRPRSLAAWAGSA